MNVAAVKAAQVAIDAHTKKLGIEGGNEIQTWHLLYSLIEWCDAKHLSLDTMLDECREEIRAERSALARDSGRLDIQ